VLEKSPELMVIAINPQGAPGSDVHNNEESKYPKMSPEAYLSGNEDWNNRFNEKGVVSSNWLKYLSNARYFLGFPSKKDDYFDDDKKVVWTNLTPFVSNNGLRDLRELSPDLVMVGVESTIKLIQILEPKKIVLFGVEGFKELEEACEKKIIHTKILDNKNLEVGYINNIPAVCVNHPSGRGRGGWPISNAFVPIFIFLHSIAIQKCTTLDGVRKYMRDELKAWQKQMVFTY
jgi:hypothetical protein